MLSHHGRQIELFTTKQTTRAMLFRPHRQLTFANFESRPGSVHARSAAARFASSEGIVYGEPVLILAGRKGAGKTHLLHAAANLARSNERIQDVITISAVRLTEEVQRATEYGDLPSWLTRFSGEDFLAIDDVDDLYFRAVVSEFVVKVLQLRVASRRRTLLSATLTAAQDTTCALNTFLNHQTAIRLI